MSRLMSSIEVVLPQPEGPTKTTISPVAMDRFNLSTAGTSWPGKTLLSSSNSIMVGAVAPPSSGSGWALVDDSVVVT